MAGHSKWANTKYRKAVQDTKREKMFTKIIRELGTAAKNNNNGSNSRLRAAIDKALLHNIPRETINRAIIKSVGSNNHTIPMETIIYEGYGPGGTAVMVECLSDNRNRTVSEIRHAFTKNGGHLGQIGSVSYLFIKCGIISFAPGISEDVVMPIALEAGANDIITYDDGAIDVYTMLNNLYKIKDTLEAANFFSEHTKITMIPSIRTTLNNEITSKLLHLIDILENCDDVQEIYHNGEFSNVIRTTL